MEEEVSKKEKSKVAGGKFLTFSLGNEDYGIPINTVREIIGIMKITHIPKTPNYIRGVINLRGKIVPIMDLRLKFGIEEKEYNERTCIVVVQISYEKIFKSIGIVVDTVSEVLNINEGEIENTMNDEVQNEGDFITGMGKVKDKVVMLLDINKVLDKGDLKYLEVK